MFSLYAVQCSLYSGLHCHYLLMCAIIFVWRIFWHFMHILCIFGTTRTAHTSEEWLCVSVFVSDLLRHKFMLFIYSSDKIMKWARLLIITFISAYVHIYYWYCCCRCCCYGHYAWYYINWKWIECVAGSECVCVYVSGMSWKAHCRTNLMLRYILSSFNSILSIHSFHHVWWCDIKLVGKMIGYFSCSGFVCTRHLFASLINDSLFTARFSFATTFLILQLLLLFRFTRLAHAIHQCSLFAVQCSPFYPCRTFIVVRSLLFYTVFFWRFESWNVAGISFI